MIRTVDKVPEWVYEFAGKVPIKEHVLKCKPLEETVFVDITYKRDMQTVYSDGRFGDPYKPIAVLPMHEERRVKVIYSDYSEYGYYLQGKDLKFVPPRVYGYAYYTLKHDNWPAYEYPMELNKAYHEFMCGEVHTYLYKLSEKQDKVYVVFRDIVSAEWYITRSILYHWN